jgi:hypothetical protein
MLRFPLGLKWDFELCARSGLQPGLLSLLVASSVITFMKAVHSISAPWQSCISVGVLSGKGR